jgi:two-component system, OmpR family, sensor kinase
MSIRWRLALWYGTLFALVLLTSATHAAEEAHRMGGTPHLVESAGGFGVLLRLYDEGGNLQEQSPGASVLPLTMPRQVLETPAGPAFDRLVGWIPSLQPTASPPTEGAFGFLQTPEQRWRVYVLPLHQAQTLTGYIETIAPLGRLDQVIERYRRLLLALGITSLGIVLVGGWALASRALAPIAQVIQTAQGRNW